MFQPDNARPHVAYIRSFYSITSFCTWTSTVECFNLTMPDHMLPMLWVSAVNNVWTLPWPARSPVLNPIEHPWDALDQRVYWRNPSSQTLPLLLMALHYEWQNIPHTAMHCGCKAVIAAHSGCNRFWHFADTCHTYVCVHVSRGFPEILFLMCTWSCIMSTSFVINFENQCHFSFFEEYIYLFYLFNNKTF